MTFNEGVRADPGRVRSSRGAKGAAIGGGAGVIALLVFLFTGQDVSGILGGGEQVASQPGDDFSHCQTGADANEFVECRMVFTADALDQYWVAALPEQAGIEYQQPAFTVFENSVGTGCGNATSAVGPFYCPPDAGVYLDTGFFDQLETRLGAENAPLAQMYIVAHEWGHHISNQQGIMDAIDRQDTGPTSDGVRLELQADCYAGMWVGQAATVVDPDSGETFIQPPTRQQVADALDAAAAVGDDRIQQGAGQEVNPEAWTHGSAEQRMRWFTTGYEQGSMAACDTFSAGRL
ncbi:KPN_02809 family neutral zinc metallopeptidase [Georgenia subflava]|uniref:Neutral zinc metallopeptidase n=1 Tax=Georgenia subflava TaxID=1622177 RepID=A0A6N7EKJ8_9MICO|nr:neutral zinc metallopeptidase [Georgenia subflava]MPV35794.1 neutral zinc metallopeptidase [Georgenia subflava]